MYSSGAFLFIIYIIYKSTHTKNNLIKENNLARNKKDFLLLDFFFNYYIYKREKQNNKIKIISYD